MKFLVAFGVAAVALSASPASADNRHHGRECVNWHHGHCTRWANHGYAVSTHRHARYKMGYVFGPSYGYTAYSAIPHTYVSRYRLNPDYRYVYTDNYIYVVDPKTYAVERVIDAMIH